MEGYVIAIDQSTSSSKVLLLDAAGEIVRRAAAPQRQAYPAPGHIEQDAEAIYQDVVRGIRSVLKGIDPSLICALGLCNQRETTVFWDRATGRPVHPALSWQDVRSQALCASLDAHKGAVAETTGLSLSPYYSAAKAAHVLQVRPDLAQAAAMGQVCIGTVDSYLLYRLSGNKAFATDVTNASRTALMNLRTLGWDEGLCALFAIPVAALAPAILPSDARFGTLALDGCPAVPIHALLGDSHASLFGHGCVRPGMAKATYGTGSSVLMNVGTAPVFSQSGLTTSVAFGFSGQVHYALEGNVTASGDTLCWLRDEIGLLGDLAEAEPIAASVPDTDGVMLVPAFAGLGAPYFDEAARAILCGMHRGTTRAHIIRAALESIAQQDADILDIMQRDSGTPLSALRVDGGASANGLLMQLQADLAGCPVACAAVRELSAVGAGYMAGIAAGLYAGLDDIPARSAQGARYAPAIGETQRAAKRAAWQLAIARARLTPAGLP